MWGLVVKYLIKAIEAIIYKKVWLLVEVGVLCPTYTSWTGYVSSTDLVTGYVSVRVSRVSVTRWRVVYRQLASLRVTGVSQDYFTGATLNTYKLILRNTNS